VIFLFIEGGEALGLCFAARLGLELPDTHQIIQRGQPNANSGAAQSTHETGCRS
jgi:hypothetical protein